VEVKRKQKFQHFIAGLKLADVHRTAVILLSLGMKRKERRR